MKLEEQVLAALLEKKWHICFVESCTGGMLASRFIGAGGASGAIEQSFITYSDRAKEEMVGVSKEILEQYGAISSETAAQMAIGGAKKAHCQVCVSVTGNAGPSADEGKPVGLVYIGIYCNGTTQVKEFNLTGNRQEIREMAVCKALEMILDKTLE